MSLAMIARTFTMQILLPREMHILSLITRGFSIERNWVGVHVTPDKRNYEAQITVLIFKRRDNSPMLLPNCTICLTLVYVLRINWNKAVDAFFIEIIINHAATSDKSFGIICFYNFTVGRRFIKFTLTLVLSISLAEEKHSTSVCIFIFIHGALRDDFSIFPKTAFLLFNILSDTGADALPSLSAARFTYFARTPLHESVMFVVESDINTFGNEGRICNVSNVLSQNARAV